jgi:hypothetical protein
MNSILLNRKIKVKNLSLRRLEFMPQKPRIKMPFKNSISGSSSLPRITLYNCGQVEGAKNYLHQHVAFQSCSLQYIFFGVQRKGQGDSDGLVLALFSMISLCRGSPRNAGLRKMYSRPYVASEANHCNCTLSAWNEYPLDKETVEQDWAPDCITIVQYTLLLCNARHCTALHSTALQPVVEQLVCQP